MAHQDNTTRVNYMVYTTDYDIIWNFAIHRNPNYLQQENNQPHSYRPHQPCRSTLGHITRGMLCCPQRCIVWGMQSPVLQLRVSTTCPPPGPGKQSSQGTNRNILMSNLKQRPVSQVLFKFPEVASSFFWFFLM